MMTHTDIPTPPLELINVGDGEFRQVGDLFLPLFVELGGLRQGDRVLDVGCGIGRMARPLATYLDRNGSYDGFDIVAPSIEWCREHISTRYPQFRFQHANVFNSVYNPGGTTTPAEYSFPYADSSFDFVLLTSVFTHMLPDDVDHYLAEIARVLRPGGSSFITFFLLNRESEELIAGGKGTLDLKHDFGIYRTTTEANPEHAVAYDEPSVLALYEKHGFEFAPPVHYGSWCGRSAFASYQDIVVATQKSSGRSRRREGDNVVSLDKIECIPRARLEGAHLDGPSPGPGERFGFDLIGWVVGREEAVREVHVLHEGFIVAKVAVETSRPDVAPLFSRAAQGERSGFEGFVCLLGVAPTFELQLDAVFEDESSCRFAIIKGRQRFPRLDFEPTINPVMVTSIGRTGTTLLMRLLDEHPAIVTHSEYPYETRAAAYWLHALKVLCDPASHFRSSHPDTFHDDSSWVGHHPFNCPPLTSQPGMSQWFGRAYVEEAGNFVRRSVESFYRQLAWSESKEAPTYFAEKWNPTDLPWIAWSVYPQSRELVLIRDPRDIVCSIVAFGRRRGLAFGRERYGTDEEFVENFRQPLEQLLAAWRTRRHVAHLVRYEDVIAGPEEALRGVLAYLELDASDVEGIVARAGVELPEFDGHRTSRDSLSSVGRWRRDLAPHLQEACERAFGHIISELGYGLSGEARPA
jgi:SAM-dependent methyltransferase